MVIYREAFPPLQPGTGLAALSNHLFGRSLVLNALNSRGTARSGMRTENMFRADPLCVSASLLRVSAHPSRACSLRAPPVERLGLVPTSGGHRTNHGVGLATKLQRLGPLRPSCPDTSSQRVVAVLYLTRLAPAFLNGPLRLRPLTGFPQEHPVPADACHPDVPTRPSSSRSTPAHTTPAPTAHSRVEPRLVMFPTAIRDLHDAISSRPDRPTSTTPMPTAVLLHRTHSPGCCFPPYDQDGHLGPVACLGRL